MHIFKKWPMVVAVASLGALLLPISSLAASGGDFWTSGAGNMPPKETLRIVWKDAITDGVFFSTDPRNTANSEANRAQISQGFNTVLGVCESKPEPGCIASVEYKVGETWQSAVAKPSPGQRSYAFGRISPQGTWDIATSSTYAADPEHGFFRAAEPNLFSFPDAKNRLGDTYWVNAVVNNHMSGDQAKISGIDISVWGVGTGGSCAMEDRVEGNRGSFCNTLVNIPKDLEIRVSVFLGDRISELSGWFDGRMIHPTIDFGVEKPGYVTVSGTPVEVSTAGTSFIPKGDPLYDVGADVEKMQGNVGEPRQALGRTDGIWNWNKFGSKVVEKALSTNTYWRVSSWLNNGQDSLSCGSVTGVKGVVLSNAAAYTPTAPKWNRSTGSLDFEVASTHLKADGSLNEGFYDLLLNEKVAKCIWGNSVKGNTASISVINADGSPQTATTTFAISGGWAKFKAYGYHYSSPTISVKLEAEKAAAPKKTTITCVSTKNKKLTKKITAVSPKCPAGFKKK